jgi:hypothetical protein
MVDVLVLVDGAGAFRVDFGLRGIFDTIGDDAAAAAVDLRGRRILSSIDFVVVVVIGAVAVDGNRRLLLSVLFFGS